MNISMNISKNFIFAFLVVSLCVLTAQAKKEKELSCYEMANIGLCVIDPRVHKKCLQVCDKRFQTYFLNGRGKSVDPLREMNIKTSIGQTIEMEDLEGYPILFIPLIKDCRGYHKGAFNFIERLQKKYNNDLEVVVFPFEHPKVNLKGVDCTEFDEDMKKKNAKRSFQISKDIKMHGPDMHPIFKFMLDEMEIDKFFLHYINYFLFDRDMSKFEAIFAHHIVDMASLNMLIKHVMSSDSSKPLK